MVAAMVFMAALSRIIPHPWNFTPIGGMALFAAAYIERKWLALVIPAMALFLSDLMLNNLVYAQDNQAFQWFGSVWVYGSFGLITVLGWVCLQKITAFRLFGSSLMASVLFFLITNAGAWASVYSPYPPNMAGLSAAYLAGLPFFWNTLAGDLVYTFSLFGLYAWVRQRYPAVSGA